jgi:hypothetical protein
MAMAQNAIADLVRFEREREALRISAAALDQREIDLKRALARERAERLGAAFSALDLGDVSKTQAAQFAKAAQTLGLVESVARLTTK